MKLSNYRQFTKFVAIGFLNTAIDFGVLNLLIYVAGISSGLSFTLFKSVSFVAANINSYFWNRFWVFKSHQESKGIEYLQFLVVSLVAIAINVGTASLVVNFIPIQFGLAPTIWANLGAAAGVAAGLIWNFLGYKFIVFKEREAAVDKEA